jgi:hypothetical protein
MAGVPELSDLVALSPTDVWAVGKSRAGPASSMPVIAHWDGRRLHVARAFRPSGRSGELTAIAALSRRNLWAVGTVAERPLVEHWNGRYWKVVATPHLRSAARLSGVAALSGDDVWAVGSVGGSPLSEHWDGRRWRVVEMHREGELAAVDGTSRDDVWAVGGQGLCCLLVDLEPLAMHWNGRRWKEVAAEEYEAQFRQIDVVSATEAWATVDADRGAEIARWDGRRWHLEQHVFSFGDEVEGLAVLSPKAIVAVGTYNDPNLSSLDRPIIVRWDGRRWRPQHGPFADPTESLVAVAALSPQDVWAAGDFLVARYSC